ncbi:MAG TPA: type III pantothenate kinase [Candidatus Faeciplasma avium]|uniref:Type III pantothenate kinase n=1 Tax=Candidatus Faeciplasma avium TaxID=2840798 RepID=A0A9D1NPH7_9FIRM|nr:type III pantothenate kinase [Candidatus Faeciplasma avium]
MIFTVDVGNTNIVLGVFDGDRLVLMARVATESQRTEDEYAVTFNELLGLNGITRDGFEGAVISSVVPQLIIPLKNAVKKLFGVKALIVGPGIRTGLNIRLDDPAVLGADLVCGAVGALCRYKAPLIIFDFGTATTISGIDRSGTFLGGSIVPGINVSLRALSSSAAQLRDINTDAGEIMAIGTNTIDCMRSGVILGNASMVDGMIARYRDELGQDASVIATGGLAASIVPHCKTDGIIIDEDLLLDGMLAIYHKNCQG